MLPLARRLCSLFVLFLCMGAGLFSQRGEAVCSSDLHVKKVALMFLARGGMPLEDLWEQWFRSVVNLIPVHSLRQQLCDSHDIAYLHGLECPAFNPNLPILQQQLLFSVYVHSSRQDFREFPRKSVFFGTLVARMGKAIWGDTTEATRILLKESLKDHLNHAFVLLSDSDIPLYPAKMTYNQLIREQKSRVDACHAYDYVNINRYTCAMADDGVDLHHWRKSNLFMLLTRKHAEMFRDDQVIYKSFQEKCSGVLIDEDIQEFRGCLVDEHYYGSFLAAQNLSHETDCIGAITLANFTNSVRGHPKLYNDTDVHPGLMDALRRTISWLPQGKCANETTYSSAKNAFLTLPISGDQLDCGHLIAQDAMPLMDTICHMFYRKVAPSAVPKLIELMSSGPGTSAIFNL